MKTVSNYYTHSWLLFLFLLFFACNSQKKIIQRQNQAVLYQPSSNMVRPDYMVYHATDSFSQLHIKLDISELLFNQANPENKLLASVKISYYLTDITENTPNPSITDSASFIRNFERQEGKNIIVITAPVKAIKGKNYNLKVSVYDLIRNVGNTGYLSINKSISNSSQNFKLYFAQNNAPVFKRYLTSADSFKIQLAKPSPKLYIRYQKDNLPLPPPPFSSIIEPVFTFQSDSIWVFPYHINTSYSMPYKGLYLVQTDSLSDDGLYLANFGETYPKVKDLKTLIAPLEYITTSEEFRKISGNDSLKLSVDNFWFKLSANADVSRELIRVYYNRMQYANLYFTSFKPGWKTDRGMIYMIFGPPSYIKKTENSEIWQYYVKQEASNLTIHFIKTFSPYSDNHYVMQRNNTFTSFWRDAVSSWRQGIAYSLEE